MSATARSAESIPARRHPVLRVLRLVGAWLALEVLMVGLAVAWVAVYSYLIDPGHEAAYYDAYAQRAVPIVALLLSAPVFAAFAFVCGRRAGAGGARFARNATLFVAVADGAFFALTPSVDARAWVIWGVASLLKLAGAVAGGRLGARAAEARS